MERQEKMKSSGFKRELKKYLEYKNDLVTSESIPVISSNTETTTLDDEENQRKIRE